MDSKKKQLIALEEARNTQQALDRSESAFTADMELGRDVPPSSLPSGISDAMHAAIIAASAEQRAETLYEMFMRHLKTYIRNIADKREKEQYFQAAKPTGPVNPLEYMDGRKLKPSAFFNKFGIGTGGNALYDLRTHRNKSLSEKLTLKLIFALQLNTVEANAFYQKARMQAGFKCTPDHQVITKHIAARKYKFSDIQSALEDKRKEIADAILNTLRQATQNEAYILSLKNELCTLDARKMQQKANAAFETLLAHAPYRKEDYFENPFINNDSTVSLSDTLAPYDAKALSAEIDSLKHAFFKKLGLFYALSRSAADSVDEDCAKEETDTIDMHSKQYDHFQKSVQLLKNADEAKALSEEIDHDIVRMITTQDVLYEKLSAPVKKHVRKYILLDRLIEKHNQLLRRIKKHFSVAFKEKKHKPD